MLPMTASPTAATAVTAISAEPPPPPPPLPAQQPVFTPIWSPTALLGAVHGGESVLQEFWKSRVRLEETLQYHPRADSCPHSPDDFRRCARGRPHTANNNSSKVGCTLHYGFEGMSRERHLTETGAKLAEPYFHPKLSMPLDGSDPERMEHHELKEPGMGSGREVPRIRRVPCAPSNVLQTSAISPKPGCRIMVVKPQVPKQADLWLKERKKRGERTDEGENLDEAAASPSPSPRLDVAALVASSSPPPRPRQRPPRVRPRHQGKPHLYSTTHPTTPHLHIATPRSATPMSGRGFGNAAATVPPGAIAATMETPTMGPAIETGPVLINNGTETQPSLSNRLRPASYGGRRTKQTSGSSNNSRNICDNNNNNNDPSNRAEATPRDSPSKLGNRPKASHSSHREQGEACRQGPEGNLADVQSTSNEDDLVAQDAMSSLYQALLGKGPQSSPKSPARLGQRPQSERSSYRRQAGLPEQEPNSAKQQAVLQLERQFFSRTSRTRPAGVEPVED